MPTSNKPTEKHLPNFKRILRWLDDNILLVLSGFLLAFIPLFPKIPFFSPIEEYIVRVRFEDFVIGFTGLVWLIQFARKKIRWQTPLNWFIAAYILVSLLSVISAVLLIKTIPVDPVHIGKSVLHFFRYIEYFSLLFIVFSSIRTRKDVMLLLGIMVCTLVGVGIYGYGQKYFYWPVYSTMNREFSKGVRLYLTDHARVQSTFAGHYDLSAYLVIILPIVLALAYSNIKKGLKIGLFIVHAMGVWLLIVGAARTSFAAYGVSMALVVLFFAVQKQGLWKKIRWGTTHMILNLVMVAVLLSIFGDDIYERFVQVLDSYPQISSSYHQLNKQRKDLVASIPAALGIKFDKGAPPANGLSTDEAVAVLVASDERPVPYRPADVYVDVPNKVVVATESADGTKKNITIEVPRTWSENSLRYGLSLGIRLDTLWPQAIRGFLRNPLFGSGYATLNKAELTEFTIAESTDNNFLRTLGETGLLGFISFYGMVVFAIILAWKQRATRDPVLRAVALGYVAATIGLLLNAAYIDVFASSKVAFTFWSVTGLMLGYIVVNRNTKYVAKNR
jgi:hypothetical protein